MQKPVYTMAIEIVDPETGWGEIGQHPFHLGTDERVARQFVVEAYEKYRPIPSQHRVKSVGLILDGVIVDIYDGSWFRGGARKS